MGLAPPEDLRSVDEIIADEQKAAVLADVEKLATSATWQETLKTKGWADTYLAGDAFEEQLARRSMIVKKCQPLAIECVVRGYLAGSGWKEYQADGAVCGISLPAGLQESAELSNPIFTPATKAKEGHDENIPFARACEIVGQEIAQKVWDLSERIYSFARELARAKGIIIADTKFEFGLLDGEVILIDEVLTSDSSRFWPQDEYEPGRGQSSFDKQFVRDYLEGLDWNKQPPGPELPAEIITKTQDKYIEAYERITGRSLD